MSEALIFWKAKTGHIINLSTIDGVVPPIKREEKNGIGFKATDDWYFQVICAGACITVGFGKEDDIREDFADFIDLSQIEQLLVNDDEEDDDELPEVATPSMLTKFKGLEVYTRWNRKEKWKIKDYANGKWIIEQKTGDTSTKSMPVNANDLVLAEENEDNLITNFEEDSKTWDKADVILEEPIQAS